MKMFSIFFFNDTATTEIYTLSLHDALPISAPWLAVTGTNGKTTTVTMLEAILLAGGRRAVAAGNVGRPLVEVVTARGDDGAPAYDVVAVELSSFQLHWSSTLAPRSEEHTSELQSRQYL